MGYTLFNLIAFQIGWFACILGAAYGVPWAGPAYVAAWIGVHLFCVSDRASEITLILIAMAMGYFADSVLTITGMLRFDASARLGWPAPLWMVALWANLAATLNYALGWLKGRYALAAGLGLIAGPLTYWAGARLGALALHEQTGVALAAIGVEWLVATPLLAGLARMTRQWFGAGGAYRHGDDAPRRTMPGNTPAHSHNGGAA